MIRLAKLTDYGFVVLTRFAVPDKAPLQNARDLAGETGVPLPTVSKLLKILARRGLLTAHRGSKGGYSLSKPPEQTTVAEIIDVLEGTFAITECIADDDCGCVVSDGCRVRGHWELINKAVQDALSRVTLADMAAPPPRPRRPVEEPVLHACASSSCGSNGERSCTCDSSAHTHIGEKV